MVCGPSDIERPSKKEARVSLAVSGAVLVRKNATATINAALVNPTITQYSARCAAAQNFSAKAWRVSRLARAEVKGVPDCVSAHSTPTDIVRKGLDAAKYRQMDGRVTGPNGKADKAC